MMSNQLDLFHCGERGAGPTDATVRTESRRTSSQRGGSGDDELRSQVAELAERLDQITHSLCNLEKLLTTARTIKEAYTTKEVAQILGKSAYTIREYCRLQRVSAFKAPCGRGAEDEWRISHEELTRIQNEGLLPVPDRY